MLFKTLRPTRWLVLGWTLVLGLRAISWYARAALERPDASAREAIKGALWDVVLVYALFALARWGRALVDRQGGPAATRLAGWLSLGLALVIATVSPILRCFDIGHCWLGGCHWAVTGFQHMHPELLSRLLQGQPLVLTLTGALMTAALVSAVWRDGRSWRRQLGQRASLRWLTMPLLVALLPATWAIRDGLAYPASVYELRLLPETNFISKLTEALADDGDEQPPPAALPAALRKRFATLGLMPQGEPVAPGYPLTRAGLEPEPVPFARHATATEQPNVVLTFVESLSGLFVAGVGGRFAGLTPELDALAKQMTVVRGFHNTSSPTISALVTAMCGLHPPTHPRDLGVGETVDGATAYVCLADLLRQRGYRTVFVQSAGAEVTAMGYFLRTHGFDEVHDRATIKARWPEGPEGIWGVHDDRLIDYATEQIKRLEAARKEDGRPFLVVLMTLDTHDPGMAADDCDLPRDANGNALVADLPDNEGAQHLLAAYHCTDRALGHLGRFLLQPPRREHTLWLLSTDHAAFRTPNSRPLLSDPKTGWECDPAPLLIHDPQRDLPGEVQVLSGTQDVAPTVLHLLGIEPKRHAMTGHSVFGRRRQLPTLVGRVGGRTIYLQSASARRELTLIALRRLCAQKALLLPDGSDPLSACELAAWVDWQDALWRSRTLFPALGAYHGSAGVDERWLRGQMEANPAEKAAERAATRQPLP